jgi:Phosphotransferase enzyme family
MPGDPRFRGRCIEAEDWKFDDARARGADVLVWGRTFTRAGTPPTRALKTALQRERALATLSRRAPGGFRARGVHRLPPPALVARPSSRRWRTLLLAGAMVELAVDPDIRRVLDAASEAAGISERMTTFRCGSGGSLIAEVEGSDGRPLFFRASPAGSPADPARAARALELLSASAVRHVPVPLGRGRVAVASWTTESVLRGRSPKRIDTSLWQQIGGFCARLPRTGDVAHAWRDDLDLVMSAFPDRSHRIRDLSEMLQDRLASVPGVLRHGDLWARNILVADRRLSGVLDWDAWHADGVPGTDLLYLYVSEQWRATRLTLGELWSERPWRSDGFAVGSRPYWDALGIEVDPETLDGIGVAAWAAQVAGNLTRLPQVVDNERWVANNIDGVLARLV